MRKSRRGFSLIELLVVIAIIALLVSILLPALATARRAARLAVCQSNLHQLATAHHTYSSDFKSYLAEFHGRAGDIQGNFGVGLATPNMVHFSLQAMQIMRTYEPGVSINEFPGTYGGDVPIITEAHSHMVLVEYLGGGKLIMPAAACPEDRARLDWQKNPAGIAQSSFRPRKSTPDHNLKNMAWLPYSSSYQLMPESIVGDKPITPRANGTHSDGLTFSQGSDHDLYQYHKLEQMGLRKISDIVYPGGKVAVADSQQRHVGKRDLFFAYPEVKQPLLFWDGSVSVRITGDANIGWDRSNPSKPGPGTPGGSPSGTVSFAYNPDLGFESPTRKAVSTGRESLRGGYYKWTRGGLRGIDYGGSEISTSTW